MPGIFGIIDTSAPLAEGSRGDLVDLLNRMSTAMRYESSYSVCITSCPELGAYVGRVGFPLDVDEGTNGQTDLFLVTTGEPIINRSATCGQRDDAEAIGIGAREVTRAYRQFGEEGLKEVSGAFAGFLVDRRHSRCLLFNDRYGVERIFLHTHGPRTFFSSEAKAILAVAPQTRAFDPAGLAQFLACGCTLGSQSLFQSIEVLEGGTIVTFNGTKTATRRRYFDRASLEGIERLPENRFMEGFSESLRSAVADSVRRPPGVGVSLTGGLDSRMIMACLDSAPGSVPCYTFGSMYGTTFDVSIARQVAARSGQPHQILELDRGFLTGIQENLKQSAYISDGYMGFSGAAELYLNRLARSIAPGRITGNWGGELMRGVRAFKYVVPKGGFIRPVVMQRMSESADAFASTAGSNPLSFALFHQMPVQGYGRYAIERSQVRMRSPFLAHDVVRSLYQAPPSVRESSECASAIIRRRPELLAIPTDAGQLGTGVAPVRFARRAYRRAVVKAEYLTSHGAPNWLAALSASLPSGVIETRFLGRDKFQHFRLWIRTEFAQFVRETLIHGDDERMDAWFDMRKVAAMVQDHIAGRGNYSDEIDKLMTVAMTHRTLFTRFEQGQ